MIIYFWPSRYCITFLVFVNSLIVQLMYRVVIFDGIISALSTFWFFLQNGEDCFIILGFRTF